VVAGALRRGDGRWLLHRRPLAKQHGGLWEFPGGKVEAGELPVSALVRELHEELGISVEVGSLLPLAFAQDGLDGDDRGIVILLYSVAEWEGKPHALEDGSAIGWFSADEISALERPPLDIALCAQIFAAPAGRNGAG
jgi:8-oxo-dGTP diphosphatase